MPADILSSHFRTRYEDVLTPRQRTQAVESLKDYIYDLQHGTVEQQRDLDAISDEDTDEELVQRKVNATLERCYWQLVMFLRCSRPSRIAEAEPYLRALMKSDTVANDATHYHDTHTRLHLAAALTHSAPDEALSLFMHAFSLYDARTPLSQNALGLSVACRRSLPPKTELWARAAYARLLRETGHADEAARQTSLMCEFVRAHPYALPMDKYRPFIQHLSSEFGLQLACADTDAEHEHAAPTSLQFSVIVQEPDVDSPASPTLSIPSTVSSSSSSPVTPLTPLIPAEQLSDGVTRKRCDVPFDPLSDDREQ